MGSKKTVIVLIASLLLFLAGCHEREPERDPDSHYEIPSYQEVYYDAGSAYYGQDVSIDVSHSGEGYFAVTAVSSQRLKLQVRKDDLTYNYELNNEGNVCFYPFQLGNGSYTIRVMENIEDNKYSEKYRIDKYVELSSEFAPFLHSSYYIKYTPESDCVKLAHDLASQSADSIDFIGKVYQYVVKNISYDRRKAREVKSGYLPDVDETLKTGKGICFDYASLAASMLRSQGVPAKMIFGYVAPNDLYHAWNMVYTKEQGWITVKFSVDQNTWNRVDLTFSASGEGSEFIGDGSNYADLYQY